jgi:hypothetical protein
MPESKRFLLRLDPRLFEALRRWAEDDLRSINGQIEYLLTERVRNAGRLPHSPRRRREDPREVSPDDEDDSIDSGEPAAAGPR